MVRTSNMPQARDQQVTALGPALATRVLCAPLTCARMPVWLCGCRRGACAECVPVGAAGARQSGPLWRHQLHSHEWYRPTAAYVAISRRHCLVSRVCVCVCVTNRLAASPVCLPRRLCGHLPPHTATDGVPDQGPYLRKQHLAFSRRTVCHVGTLERLPGLIGPRHAC